MIHSVAHSCLACSCALAFVVATTHAEAAAEIEVELAQCAEIENALERGQCYDALVERLELAPKAQHSRPSGHWKQRVDKSKFDDSKSVYLHVDADEEIQIGRYDVVQPILLMRCHENTTAIFISFDHFLGSDDIAIEYRIDREKTRSAVWYISSNHNSIGLWRGRTSIPFIRRLFGKDRILIRLTPYGDSPVTASFTVTGLRSAIGELAEACRWAP